MSFLVEGVALLERGKLGDSVAGDREFSLGLLRTAELALAEFLSGEMSLWGYPDLPPFNIVVLLLLLWSQYKPAILLEHSQVHDLLESLFKMQVPRLSTVNLSSAIWGRTSEICPQEILVQLVRWSHLEKQIPEFPCLWNDEVR